MKFIHTADIHLGAEPDKGFPWSKERQEEIWDSFRRLIAQVKKEDADILLIAGDLFHRQPLKSELKEVNYLFSTIPNTQVVFMAGNHDYIKSNSYYRGFPWNSNVHFLDSDSIQCVFLKELEVYVYGMSYYSREITANYYDHAQPNGKQGVHILLAHGGDEKHIPMKFAQLSRAGFDYVALGHIHKPQIVEDNKIIYPGALEPLDRNDTGSHGYVVGRIEGYKVRTEFVPFAKRSYISLEIKTGEDMSQSHVEALIGDNIGEMGRENLYKVTLVGSREADGEYNLDRIKRLGNIVEAEDYTEPAFDFQRLHEQYEGTIIGKYIEQFPAWPEGVELKALHYGIQALLETKR